MSFLVDWLPVSEDSDRCLGQRLLTPTRSAERLIELLREFPSDEPTRKRYIQEIIGWSGRYGPLERGDPELHHAAGSVYAEGRYFVLDPGIHTV